MCTYKESFISCRRRGTSIFPSIIVTFHVPPSTHVPLNCTILISLHLSRWLYPQKSCIQKACKREELDVFSREVVRFGDMCKDPQGHNLDHFFPVIPTNFKFKISIVPSHKTLPYLLPLIHHKSSMLNVSLAIEEQLISRAIKEECLWESLPKRLQMSLNSKDEWHRSCSREFAYVG